MWQWKLIEDTTHCPEITSLSQAIKYNWMLFSLITVNLNKPCREKSSHVPLSTLQCFVLRNYSPSTWVICPPQRCMFKPCFDQLPLIFFDKTEMKWGKWDCWSGDRTLSPVVILASVSKNLWFRLKTSVHFPGSELYGTPWGLDRNSNPLICCTSKRLVERSSSVLPKTALLASAHGMMPTSCWHGTPSPIYWKYHLWDSHWQ